MADKNLYKIIASLIAIIAYLFITFSLITFIKNEDKAKKDYGYNVEDAIVVNIDSLLDDKPKPLEKLSPKPVQIKQPEPKPIPKPAEPVHKVEPIILPPDPVPEPEPETKAKPIILPPDPEPIEEEDARDKEAKSAKDLFSTLRTDDYKKAMRERQKQDETRASRLAKQEAKKIKKAKEAEAKREKERQKRAKASEAREAVEQMQISTPSQSKKSGEKHEFWSFVSDKIMAKWQRTISTQDGLSATVVIRINNRGKLSYSDLQSSNNSMFDTKLKVFLDNLEYDKFPSYKEGRFIEAQFEFTDKEKGL